MNTVSKQIDRNVLQTFLLVMIVTIGSCKQGSQSSTLIKADSNLAYSDSSSEVTSRLRDSLNTTVATLSEVQKTQLTEDFKITVYRQYPDNKCTSGYLAVNDQIICYTVEKPWKDNQKNISSIPAGIYGGILRYDHNDHWRIELVNVPGRDNIQIHVGNTVDDISGCILVGDKLNADLCSIVGGTSKPAYQKLKASFYGTDNPTSTPDKNITVEIKDAGPQ